MVSKPSGLKGTCVVSYHACRGQTMNRTPEHGGGEERGPREGETSKATETWLAGRGGRVALGSYRQSGGANSTRKTWGALVGETGTWSHLTRTVTLGEPGGIVHSWELDRGLFRRWPPCPSMGSSLADTSSPPSLKTLAKALPVCLQWSKKSVSFSPAPLS